MLSKQSVCVCVSHMDVLCVVDKLGGHYLHISTIVALVHLKRTKFVGKVFEFITQLLVDCGQGCA